MTEPKSSAAATLSPSPTLSVYSSRRLNDIASRVIHQLRLQGHHLHHDDDPFPFPHTNDGNPGDVNQEEEDEEEEFTFVCQPQYASPTPADQIFCDGRIRPAYTYPVLVVERQEPGDGKKRGKGGLRVTLGKFLMEERESSSSSSSSEEEEIEGAEPGSYCVWRPEGLKVQETRGKGSSSGGRWRFRDYFVLKRSTSEGQKDNFVIFRKGRGGGQH
ncbi:hypothetical protein MLD38_027912 [Melastoma candidum]|uniref:Uncharacterized protein n=1 Tax=Melastoma candidum TaxID=119954 RepID=A0ACB9N0Z8_9MYRT|nr:hypothetical protein MLD38_027912 [Melastoma candidum]